MRKEMVSNLLWYRRNKAFYFLLFILFPEECFIYLFFRYLGLPCTSSHCLVTSPEKQAVWQKLNIVFVFHFLYTHDGFMFMVFFTWLGCELNSQNIQDAFSHLVLQKCATGSVVPQGLGASAAAFRVFRFPFCGNGRTSFTEQSQACPPRPFRTSFSKHFYSIFRFRRQKSPTLERLLRRQEEGWSGEAWKLVHTASSSCVVLNLKTRKVLPVVILWRRRD